MTDDLGVAAVAARAATPSGLSRFASSCKHRIANAARLLNPWARIRELEYENACLAESCEDLWRDLRNAERTEWEKARRVFDANTAHILAMNEHLLAQLVAIDNLAPRHLGLAQGIEAGTATTAGRGPQDESPVANGDAP